MPLTVESLTSKTDWNALILAANCWNGLSSVQLSAFLWLGIPLWNLKKQIFLLQNMRKMTHPFFHDASIQVSVGVFLTHRFETVGVFAHFLCVKNALYLELCIKILKLKTPKIIPVTVTLLKTGPEITTRGPWATKLTRALVPYCHHLLFGLAWWFMHVRLEITQFLCWRVFSYKRWTINSQDKEYKSNLSPVGPAALI